MKIKFVLVVGFAALIWSFAQMASAENASKKTQAKSSSSNKTTAKKAVKQNPSFMANKNIKPQNRKPSQVQEEIERWDRIMSEAMSGNDPAIGYVLDSGKGLRGFDAAEYGLQLIKVYKAQPIKTIQISRNKFKNNDSCLLWWIVPATQEIEFKEVTNPLQLNASSPIAQAFYQSALKYRRAILDRATINYEGCVFF